MMVWPSQPVIVSSVNATPAHLVLCPNILMVRFQYIMARLTYQVNVGCVTTHNAYHNFLATTVNLYCTRFISLLVSLYRNFEVRW